MSTYTRMPTRSETEVAADLLFALLDARLLHPDTLNRALPLAGLTFEDLADAKMRAELGRARVPRRAPVWPTREEPWTTADAAESHASRTSAGAGGVSPMSGGPGTCGIAPSPPFMGENRAPTKLASVPRPADPPRDQSGRRRAGRRITPEARWLEPSPDHAGERFCATCGLWLAVEDFTANKATCRACLNSRRRQRYLSVEREAAVLEATMRFVRAGADPELVCGKCRKSIGADEECVVVGEVRCGGCCPPRKPPASSHSAPQGRERIIGV